MRMAIAGGTGQVGKFVVAAARERGHTPVVISRSAGADIITGAGLDAALDKADVVIDVSNITTMSRAKSVDFFGTGTKNLLAAEQRAGVRHHIALSIVGIDRVDVPYYQGKLRQEELALAGPVPVTVLRATQFHEFAEQMLGNAIGPIAPVPQMLTRPVAAKEVATTLVDLAEGEPQGRVLDLSGPKDELMPSMVRRLIAARGLRKLVVPFPVPGAGGRAMRTGGLVPTGDSLRGTITYDDWLRGQAAARRSG